jgi:hypothetical protein
MKAALRPVRCKKVEDRRTRVSQYRVEIWTLRRESGRVGRLGRERRGHGLGGAVGFDEVAALEVWLERESFYERLDLSGIFTGRVGYEGGLDGRGRNSGGRHGCCECGSLKIFAF